MSLLPFTASLYTPIQQSSSLDLTQSAPHFDNGAHYQQKPQDVFSLFFPSNHDISPLLSSTTSSYPMIKLPTPSYYSDSRRNSMTSAETATATPHAPVVPFSFLSSGELRYLSSPPPHTYIQRTSIPRPTTPIYDWFEDIMGPTPTSTLLHMLHD
jgi:hypothetical protein